MLPVGLALGGESLLRRKKALAGQPAIVIGNQLHNGIIPFKCLHFKPFFQASMEGAGPAVPISAFQLFSLSAFVFSA
jgi:hypothetical protein